MAGAKRFFGQYLLERAVVSRRQLLHAMTQQDHMYRPFACLLVASRTFTPEQLDHLDRESADTGRSQVETALREKLVTLDRLEKLGAGRIEPWMPLAETLLRRQLLTLRQLYDILPGYAEAAGPSLVAAALEPHLSELPQKALVTGFLEAALDLFIHYTRQLFRITGVAQGPGVTAPRHLFLQRITGREPFHFALAMSGDVATAIARTMTDEEHEGDEPLVADAVKEFLNTISGNGCGHVPAEFGAMSPGPPMAAPEMASLFQRPGRIAITMETARGPLEAWFLFDTEIG